MTTVNQVLMCLPDPPEGHTHSVEIVSPRVMRVVLHHPDVYSYTTEPVVTVWGFIKGDNVHNAKSYDKPHKEVLCKVVDSWKLSGYSSTKTTITSLQHLK